MPMLETEEVVVGSSYTSLTMSTLLYSMQKMLLNGRADSNLLTCIHFAELWSERKDCLIAEE